MTRVSVDRCRPRGGGTGVRHVSRMRSRDDQRGETGGAGRARGGRDGCTPRSISQEPGRRESLPGHRDRGLRAVEHADVAAEIDRADRERSRPGELDQRHISATSSGPRVEPVGGVDRGELPEQHLVADAAVQRRPARRWLGGSAGTAPCAAAHQRRRGRARRRRRSADGAEHRDVRVGTAAAVLDDSANPGAVASDERRDQTVLSSEGRVGSRSGYRDSPPSAGTEPRPTPAGCAWREAGPSRYHGRSAREPVPASTRL